MRFIRWSAAFASLALVGCFAFKPVEVRITPTAYQVGEVKSSLATPAVDEVVRIKPSKVLIVLCKGTHPMRVIQFEQELSARHHVELSLILVDKGCPAA
ncbi:hypothetical protein [Variovorax paradoxus]|uniref:hypothetical protein n=1 Tax=Variovorax paradoxus TaxID=34073 RepID=UPI0012D41718|nr:hypothetical protein [Variovorax paradoxus]